MTISIRNVIAILLLVVFIRQQGTAQSINKITGPLGVYHTCTGYGYNNNAGTDSILVQHQFRFGDILFANQAVDAGVDFSTNVDSCIQWHANRVFGIIQPPSEMGANNQPADTSLYYPYPQPNGPGMVQGGHRFSQLSKLYGPFCGAMIDDIPEDTPTLHQIRDAILGKQMDENGIVNGNSAATTPLNKLYGVIYHTTPNPILLPFVDGFSFWYNTTIQDCCYMNIDEDITQLKKNCPNKEIMIGIYLQYDNWETPVSVQYMLKHALDRYDDGDINGIIFFSGPFLSRDYMPLNEWNTFSLPPLLDSVYFPYLGTGQGKLYDCTTSQPVANAFVRIYCAGKNYGDTLLRSRQQTDATGAYQFGVWAGNRDKDSTYYWLITDKEGYHSDTTGFWIKRNKTTVIPALSLCPAYVNPKSANNDVLIFPNPSNGKFTVEQEQATGVNEVVEIYNVLGKLVYSSLQPLSHAFIDISSTSNGIYIARIKINNTGGYKQHIVVVQR